jgi:hypothetical protein
VEENEYRSCLINIHALVLLGTRIWLYWEMVCNLGAHVLVQLHNNDNPDEKRAFLSNLCRQVQICQHVGRGVAHVEHQFQGCDVIRVFNTTICPASQSVTSRSVVKNVSN